MRDLPDELLAAQKKATAVPFVSVQVRPRIGDVTRLTFERLYTGSEPDRRHAATMPADGSLVRAFVDAAGHLLVQRVASPGPGCDFSSWFSLCTIPASAPVALTSAGASVLLFYVDTGNQTIRLRASGDYGQSFASPVTVATASGAISCLAAGMKSDGTALVLYSVGPTVYSVKRSGGGWGLPVAWSNSVLGITGLACYYSIDFNVVLTGTDAGGAKVWTALYGDGVGRPLNTWSSLTELSRADSGSNVTFKAPFLDLPDLFRLSFVEKYTGNESYARPLWSHVSRFGDFAAGRWREPVPFDLTSDYGLAMAHDQSHAWLATPSGVWRAPVSTPALEVSGDVLELREDVLPFDGRLCVTLRNDDGRYSDLTDSALSAIRPSSQVDFSPGYLTESGEVVSMGPRFWIDGWQYDCRPGASTITLFARDGWWQLRRWHARREYVWGAGEKNVFQVLSFLLSRVGLECASLNASTLLTALKPSFAVHPGESGLTAVQRLLDMVPDVIRMDGAIASITNPLPDDAPTYAYGGDHQLFESRFAVTDRPVNRVAVFGKALVVEAFDWGALNDSYDRLFQVNDLNLTAVADAQARANALLRKAALGSLDGEVLTPVNCGQELYDVVTVTDARAGLDGALRRVTGLSLVYSRTRRPVYQMRLRLGAV